MHLKYLKKTHYSVLLTPFTAIRRNMMIEIPPYIFIFFNFHLHDEHDFGSFPIYVGFAEAIWTCEVVMGSG